MDSNHLLPIHDNESAEEEAARMQRQALQAIQPSPDDDAFTMIKKWLARNQKYIITFGVTGAILLAMKYLRIGPLLSNTTAEVSMQPNYAVPSYDPIDHGAPSYYTSHDQMDVDQYDQSQERTLGDEIPASIQSDGSATDPMDEDQSAESRRRMPDYPTTPSSASVQGQASPKASAPPPPSSVPTQTGHSAKPPPPTASPPPPIRTSDTTGQSKPTKPPTTMTIKPGPEVSSPNPDDPADKVKDHGKSMKSPKTMKFKPGDIGWVEWRPILDLKAGGLWVYPHQIAKVGENGDLLVGNANGKEINYHIDERGNVLGNRTQGTFHKSNGKGIPSQVIQTREPEIDDAKKKEFEKKRGIDKSNAERSAAYLMEKGDIAALDKARSDAYLEEKAKKTRERNQREVDEAYGTAKEE